ncbi:MAG: Tex family protein [Burkholderiales bacterium]
MLSSIAHRISTEIAARESQAQAAIALLDEGATVPFIARYRKEATGGLDDTQLRTLEERLHYLRELEERRATILSSIESQGKLTPELRESIEAAADKARLEDLYLPYKPKRRTKAQVAREAGLEPLADALLGNPDLVPEDEAAKYLKPAFKAEDAENAGVPDSKAALEGARQILLERFAEDADLVGGLREYFREHGVAQSKVIEGKQEKGAKFSDYFAYSERMKNVPSHRALALFRGRREEILHIALRLEGEEEKPKSDAPLNACEARIAARYNITQQGRPADPWLGDTVRWAWRVKISQTLETELMGELRARAETEAIRVFGMNLKDLLLAAPAGPRATMGLDPGLRTGVKVAVVDGTGKLLDTATIYPHAPRNDWDASVALLAALCAKHNVELISIGNGTASRETDKLTGDLLKRHPELKPHKIVVSEAGASVYSASSQAAKEFPDLDVSLRGAVSIARRVQDPLAELVKIDPKAIGVGQYQHDVNQAHLARTLNAVVEDCVNAVGVDVNTASVALLARVSGLSSGIAQSIVSHRDANGVFVTRHDLMKVPRLGEKTFELAAGFLRIMNGTNPLDASAVHPEAYPLVERILADIQREVRTIVGDVKTLKSLEPARYADEHFGVPTITDILKELEKPGRDPRPEFKTAAFKEGVEGLKDLAPGMMLEGVVTNVTNFGAFVDIGVHQDGLVHISALSNKFIKDPREVVKAGDVVRVKVVEVDEKRNRIALTMKFSDPAVAPAAPTEKRRETPRPPRDPRRDARHDSKPRPKSPQPAPRPTVVESREPSALALAMARARQK